MVDSIPQSIPLNSNSLASTLGKFGQHKEGTPDKSDIYASLLEMICYNTCQLAVLSQKGESVKNIVFTGSFVGNFEHVQQILAKWINRLAPENDMLFCRILRIYWVYWCIETKIASCDK